MEGNGLEELQRRARDVTALRRRIERWRRTRERGARMPAELWTAAVELARAHGGARIARALGVSAQGLKDRLEEGLLVADSAAAAGGFVELNPGVLSPAAPSVMELSDASGRKLVIRFSSAVDLPMLVAAFWQ